MSQPQHDDQHEADKMENPSPEKALILGFDPAVLAVLLVFVLLFSAILPRAWPLIVGVVGLGLAARWGILWYEGRQRSHS